MFPRRGEIPGARVFLVSWGVAGWRTSNDGSRVRPWSAPLPARSPAGPTADPAHVTRAAHGAPDCATAADMPGKRLPGALLRFATLLQEFRISQFAPELGTHEKTSPKILEAAWLEFVESAAS